MSATRRRPEQLRAVHAGWGRDAPTDRASCSEEEAQALTTDSSAEGPGEPNMLRCYRCQVTSGSARKISCSLQELTNDSLAQFLQRHHQRIFPSGRTVTAVLVVSRHQLIIVKSLRNHLRTSPPPDKLRRASSHNLRRTLLVISTTEALHAQSYINQRDAIIRDSEASRTSGVSEAVCTSGLLDPPDGRASGCGSCLGSSGEAWPATPAGSAAAVRRVTDMTGGATSPPVNCGAAAVVSCGRPLSRRPPAAELQPHTSHAHRQPPC